MEIVVFCSFLFEFHFRNLRLPLKSRTTIWTHPLWRFLLWLGAGSPGPAGAVWTHGSRGTHLGRCEEKHIVRKNQKIQMKYFKI